MDYSYGAGMGVAAIINNLFQGFWLQPKANKHRVSQINEEHKNRLLEFAKASELRIAESKQDHQHRIAELNKASELRISELFLAEEVKSYYAIETHQAIRAIVKNDENSPFLDSPDIVRHELKAIYEASGKPIVLVAPFWDDSRTKDANERGGFVDFRNTFNRSYKSVSWNNLAPKQDGYINRPLIYTDRDVNYLHRVLYDIPIILVHGSIQGVHQSQQSQTIDPVITFWNILPTDKDEYSNLEASSYTSLKPSFFDFRAIPNNSPTAAQEMAEYSINLQQRIGTYLTTSVGLLSSIYHLDRFGTIPDLKQFKLEINISQLLVRQMGGFYLILSERQPEKAHEYFLEQAKIFSEINLQKDAIESINKSWNCWIESRFRDHSQHFKVKKYRNLREGFNIFLDCEDVRTNPNSADQKYIKNIHKLLKETGDEEIFNTIDRAINNWIRLNIVRILKIKYAMSNRNRDWFVVIGIDFGTTFSRFTYAFSDDNKVYYYKGWDNGPTSYENKTKTQLLYINGKPEYWGYTAVIENANRYDSQAEIYRIFNFKMQLGQEYYQQHGIPEKKFLVIDLVSDYLKFIKDKALEEVGTRTIRNIKDRIIWCLTVPAFWTDEQKNKMRMAAIKAGVISNSDDDHHNLMLVDEPEAAAVYCHQKQSIRLEENDCYMIVNCGCINIDIITHTVNKKNDLLLLNPIQRVTMNGGAYGSTYVDKKFMTFLSEKITPEALDDFHKKHPVEFLHIYDRWERIKIGLTLDDFKYGTYFEIPPKFLFLLKKIHPNVLKEIEKSEGGYDYRITIKGNELVEFFDESLNGLVHEVETQFEKLKRVNRTCDYIILVGEYSACPLLQKRIQEKFGSKVKRIICDANPGAAIVEGATWLGLNPILHYSIYRDLHEDFFSASFAE
jgi:hypothetical protein